MSWKKINITDNTTTPTLDNSTKDAYIQKIGGKYLLVIEKAADGSSKGYVDLGTDKPGEPGKWSQETINGINYLSIIENAAPTLKIGGDTTAQVRETNFSGAGLVTKFGSEGSNSPFIKLNDVNTSDQLYVTLSSTGGTLSIDGTSFNSTVNVGTSSSPLSLTQINTQLEGLQFKGTTRGDGKISVTASDGYANVSGDLFFTTVPTAPAITVSSSNLSGKIGGVNPSLSGISLSDADLTDRA